jgi:hypothetical protein
MANGFDGYTSIVEPSRPGPAARSGARGPRSSPAPAVAPSGYETLAAPARTPASTPARKPPRAGPRAPVTTRPATSGPRRPATAPRPLKPVRSGPDRPLYQARPPVPASAPPLTGTTPPMTALELELAEFLLRVAERGQLLITQIDPRMHLPIREREPIARAINVLVEQASEGFYDLTGRHPSGVKLPELDRKRPADWTKARPNFTWIVRPPE